MGAWCGREETYSAQIESLLSRAGRTVNVINAGVPAWTIQQSAVYLAEEGLASSRTPS